MNLIAACRNGNIYRVREFLRKGEDVNFLYGASLHHACWKGYIKIAKTLLEYGTQVNIVVKTWTFLHDACYKGHLGIVKLLLNYGAKINVKDRDEYTSLHWACEEIIEMLIENGANDCKRCKEINNMYKKKIREQLYRYFDFNYHIQLEFKGIT